MNQLIASQRALLIVAVTIAYSFAGEPSQAGSIGVTDSGVPLHWPSNPQVRFVINPGGVPGFTGELDQLVVAGAIRDAFRAWTEVPGAAIAFTDGGLTAQTDLTFDGISLVTFQDTSFPLPPGALAVTLTSYLSSGVITDADILFNPQLPNGEFFSPVGTDGSVDLEAVAVHEIGHLLGLDHSGVFSSIMNPYSESLGSGVSSRKIQSDDAATVAALYPAATFAPSTGRISGTITTSTGTAVKSAHVVAISDPDGVPLASQLSGANGSYLIQGLPPGNYRVLVEPLDGPISLSDFSNFYASGQANFATTFFGGQANPTVFSVAAGQTATANITLPATPASVLNIQTVASIVNNVGLFGPGPLYLPRGSSYLLAATEATRATDTTFGFSVPGIVRNGPTQGGTLTSGTPVRLQNITIGASTTAAPSDLSLSNAGGTSVLVGGAVVTVNPQVATPLREGAGFDTTLAPGAFISIFGTDLAESLVNASYLPLPTSLGGVSVKIGNRYAPLLFVSPGQINALVPFEVSGNVSLQVVTGPGGAGNSVPVRLSPTSPAMFSINQQGTGQGAILIANADILVAPVGSIPGRTSRPARRDEIVSIFASGLGPVSPALASGLDAGVNGSTVPTLVNLPTVRIGGQVAALDFAGLAPHFAGLYQVNAHIPANAPNGDAVPVQITTFEGQTSNTVTIAISP